MNTVIWKLDKSIEEINNLVQITKSKEPHHKNSSVKLTYKWEGIEYKKVSNCTCLTALACIDSFNGFDVSTSRSRALFVEHNNVTYCNIRGTKSIESRIRTKLMVKRKDSIWGKVEFSCVNGYIFDKDFFYWLLRLGCQKVSLLNVP